MKKQKKIHSEMHHPYDFSLEDAFTYDEELHGHETTGIKYVLLARNIAAAAAGILFLISIFDVNIAIKAIAYFTGSIAYILELVIMTECFRVKPNHDELFMIYVFGPLYILMGVSYLIH